MLCHRRCDTQRQEVQHVAVKKTTQICFENLMRGGKEVLINVCKKKVKLEGYKVWEWEIRQLISDSALKVLVKFTVGTFFETQRKRWVGGSLEKDITETVNFLVSQKQVILFFSILSFLFLFSSSCSSSFLTLSHTGEAICSIFRFHNSV